MSDYDSLIFHAHDLDVLSVSQSIKQHGCALIRGVFNPEVIEVLAQRSQWVFQMIDKLKANPDLMNQYLQKTPELAPYIMGQVHYVVLHLLDESGQKLNQLLPLFQQTLLPTILNYYFQKDSVFLSLGTSLLRRVDPLLKTYRIPYHQDGYLIEGTQIPCINCWVPLQECGVDLPALEVVVAKVDEQLPIDNSPDPEGNIAFQKLRISDQFVEEHYPDQLWSPIFEQGDIMLMNHLTVHRTFQTPEMTEKRQSLELRFYPQVAENNPEGFKLI